MFVVTAIWKTDSHRNVLCGSLDIAIMQAAESRFPCVIRRWQDDGICVDVVMTSKRARTI